MMKKMFVSVLLVLSLLVSGAMAEETFSMTALYNANELDQLLKMPGDSMSQRSVQEDENGTLEYAYYVQLDAQGALAYTYVDDTYLLVVKNGQGYGYDFTSDESYMYCYLGDTYEKDIEDMCNGFPIMHYGDYENDDEYVQSVERKDESMIVTALFNDTPEDDNNRNRVTYTVEAETLLLQALKYEYLDKDDNVTATGNSIYTMGDTYEVDPSIEAQWSSEEMRTVTCITDPGTEHESTQSFEMPISSRAIVVAPEGYIAYTDKACTIAATSAEPDAEGHYAAETTRYYAPIQ